MVSKKYLIFDFDGTLVMSMGGILDLIYGIIEKNEPEYLDKAKYIFSNTYGKALYLQLMEVFGNEDLADKYTKIIYEKIKKYSKNNIEFFDGVPETIIELKNKGYKLYLTTGNSTEVASETLKKGGIYDCFDKVLGSDKIYKGQEHLDIFKELSGDKDFFKKSFYIGDGNSDRNFAKNANIDFIHIGDEKIDKYEIKSVNNLNKILNFK